jgi:hypothetical protein
VVGGVAPKKEEAEVGCASSVGITEALPTEITP